VVPEAAHAAPATKTQTAKGFTARVVANKVRMRTKPDLDSPIIRQFNKNDLLLVVGEKDDFYVVAPPKDVKAYVFRSYILENVVEANRVNVRLEPHVDAPIIGQLQAGDKVKGQVCTMNHKWLEIAPPQSAQFYIAKEFLEKAGGPDYLLVMEERKTKAEELLSKAFFAAETESKKPYEEMSILEPTEAFQIILRDFTDFPEVIRRAKEGLVLLNDRYLQKKIAFLEERAELNPEVKEELLAKHKKEHAKLVQKAPENPSSPQMTSRGLDDHMRLWDAVEESLFLSWSAFHTSKNMDDFYAEQKASASVLSGTVEGYPHAVKNKPGNFILRSDEMPIAYLYSTMVDLGALVGKKVHLLVSTRPNNHFAFPAYYVLGIESEL